MSPPIEGNNMHGETPGSRRLTEYEEEVRAAAERKARDYTKDGLRCIGWAVKQMRDGARVRRAGWNGKGMWLGLVQNYSVGLRLGVPDDWRGVAPFVAMYTVDKLLVPWLCSQTDLLASDWELA